MGIVKVLCGFTHSLALVSGKENKYNKIKCATQTAEFKWGTCVLN